MTDQQCTNCLQLFPLEHFYNNGTLCKKCRILTYKAKYREKNRQELRDKNKVYYKENRPKKLEYHKWYRENYKEKRLEAQRKYYKNNRELCNKKSRTNIKKLIKTSINHKLRKRLRDRIYCAIKQNIKSKHTMELLGCTTDYFKQYIESKFTIDMSWENYTRYNWNIDHIMPCSYFDMSIPENQKMCFHYTNMQPLSWYNNMKKSYNIPADFINGQRIWDDELGWIVGIYAA